MIKVDLMKIESFSKSWGIYYIVIFKIAKIYCYFFSINVPRKDSFLKRDLDARAHSEAYRLKFHLPINEKLDGSSDATLWTPYNKHHVWGTLYLSQNFVCFDSRVMSKLSV